MATTPAKLLPCVEIEPPRPARAAVVWLHGLGADGHDFVPIVPLLGLGDAHAVRFVFPHAPRIPVSINAGMVMPAWYDIRDADLEARHDEGGIRRSADHTRALIERENERGIPTQRIVLAGFSQGGAVAAFVALRHAKPLAGMMALSTYLVCGESLEREAHLANKSLAVFQAHGTDDMMVRIARGKALRDRLVEHGCDVEWRTYPMEHAVCAEEMVDIGAWLQRVLPRDAVAG